MQGPRFGMIRIIGNSSTDSVARVSRGILRQSLMDLDDSPENDRFSGFHHPVNFRSHLTSLRNRTKPTGTGA